MNVQKELSLEPSQQRPLLITKLHIPPSRPNIVPRPRLIERLDEGPLLKRKLTLISAPAGFGKTTLLSEWVSGTGEVTSPLPVAWVSLDKGDNDPTRFWAYFIAALQTMHADVGAAALAALQSRQPPPIEALLTNLINEIAELPAPLTLVLDDFHVITAPQIHDALIFCLDNLPPQMHLILAGRTDPPWPLARRRARGEMAELRTNDLRFTSEEAATFLNKVMKLDLPPEDVATLEHRTEGWIVGLQMAALSIQGQEDTSSFIQAFAGSHRFILDYLMEEVLDQQAPAIQDFLLKTSILERMSGPLCDSVTGDQDSQAILTRLEQANLFLVPLDDERCWYRYHHLFTDLLRKRLQQTQPDQVPILHRQASEWSEANGLIAEAVGYALAAGDADRAARLVERNALAMMDHGELTTLLGWLNALPDTALRRRPWLCVAYAWALAYSGQLEHIEPLLQDAEKSLASPDLDKDADAEVPVLGPSAGLGANSEVRHVAGHIATIRAYVAVLRGDGSRGAELARKALALLPEDDLTVRGFAAAQLAYALRASDGLAAATQATIEASAISKAAGDSHVAVMTLCDLAGLFRLQGHLHEAAATYQDALELAHKYERQSGRQLPIIGYVYGRMSTVLCEWHDLEAATRLAKQGVELCRQWGWTELFVDCCVYLASALQAAGDEQGALDAIQEAKQAARRVSPWYVTTVGVFEVWIRLEQGDIASASRWATAQEDELSIGDEPDSQHVARYLALVRVLITQAWGQTGGERDRLNSTWEDKLDRAIQSLTRLLQAAETEGQMMRTIEILILQALAFQTLGRIEQALTALERAISIAEPGGYVRIFVAKGALMAKLLQKAAAHGVAAGYVSKLLAAFGKAAPPLLPHPSPPLIEPLSKRELEVLRLVAAGLSNREIAAELFLAVGTVKKYTSNIYGKLNVRQRTQAVARARELGLL